MKKIAFLVLALPLFVFGQSDKNPCETLTRINLLIQEQHYKSKAVDDSLSVAVYDAFLKLADDRKSYPFCREAERAALGYKCIPYKKKYTIIFIEGDKELIICEFISSKLIYW